MRTWKWFTIMAAMALAMVLATGGQAVAKGKKKAKKGSGLHSALGDIRWGDSRKVVLKKIKEARFKKLQNDNKLKADQVAMSRARRDAQIWFSEIEKSFQKFNGKRSGFEVSVIAGEYSEKNGESMLHVRDKVAQRFFFFIDGRFYKMVVAYKREYLKGVAFEDFAGQTARRYGRPVDTEYMEIQGEEELVNVRWEDKTTELRINNLSEFFGTYTMAFTDRVKLKALAKSGKRFGGSEKEEESLSQEVASLTETSRSSMKDNAIDSLIGDVELDVNEGRPADEQIRQPDPEAAPAAKASKKSKSKKRKKRRKRKKRKSKDFSKLGGGGGGDELIIY